MGTSSKSAEKTKEIETDSSNMGTYINLKSVDPEDIMPWVSPDLNSMKSAWNDPERSSNKPSLAIIVIGGPKNSWIFDRAIDLTIPENVVILYFVLSEKHIPASFVTLFKNHIIESDRPEERRIFFNLSQNNSDYLSEKDPCSYASSFCSSLTSPSEKPYLHDTVFYLITHLNDYASVATHLQPKIPKFNAARPFQLYMEVPSASPLELHQLILGYHAPYSGLIDSTMLKIIQILGNLDDKTVFCAGKFCSTMNLNYLPFGSLLLFNMLIRSSVLVRASEDFEKMVFQKSQKQRICHVLNRQAVDSALKQSHVKEIVNPVLSFPTFLPEYSQGPLSLANSISLQKSHSHDSRPLKRSRSSSDPSESIEYQKQLQKKIKRESFEKKLKEFMRKNQAILEKEACALSDSALTKTPTFRTDLVTDKIMPSPDVIIAKSYVSRLCEFISLHFPDETTPVYSYIEQEVTDDADLLSNLISSNKKSDQSLSSKNAVQYRGRVSVVGQIIESSRAFNRKKDAEEDVARLACDYMQAYWNAALVSDGLTDRLGTFLGDGKQKPEAEQGVQCGSSSGPSVELAEEADSKKESSSLNIELLKNLYSSATQIVYEYCQKAELDPPIFTFESIQSNEISKLSKKPRSLFQCELSIEEKCKFKSRKAHIKKPDAKGDVSVVFVKHINGLLNSKGLQFNINDLE